MTNRLELNWKLDGFVDEQRYYCSETPIDPLNLPAPKDVLAGDVRTYTDVDVDVGKTYYIRIGAVKNAIEKVSDEVKVWSLDGDEHWNNVMCLLHFDGNATDEKGRTWSSSGAKYESGLFGQGARLNGSTNRYFRSPNDSNFMITGSATIEFAIKLFSGMPAGSFGGVIGQRYSYATQSFSIFINPGSSVMGFEFKTLDGDYVNVSTSLTINEMTRVAVEIDIDNQEIRLFKNGEIVSSVAILQPLNVVNYPIQIGGLNQSSSTSAQANFIIDELRITKDVCRYKNNYTPSPIPFPNK